MPAWLKGGVVGASYSLCIYLIISVIDATGLGSEGRLLFGVGFALVIFLQTPFILIPKISSILSSEIAYYAALIIAWAIIGVIIGFVYGKIKSKSWRAAIIGAITIFGLIPVIYNIPIITDLFDLLPTDDILQFITPPLIGAIIGFIISKIKSSKKRRSR